MTERNEKKELDKIEREMNEDTGIMYQKNNLILEKVILDRALEKVQKRRFISNNIQ